jgi:hypothetical protein
MVASEDGRCRVVLERRLDDFARMNRRARDGAPEPFLVGDKPVALARKQDREDLVLPAGEP